MFSEDSRIIRILTRVFDLCLLNILFVVFSIPIITIGASATALYTILLKMAANEEGYIFKGYVAAFKANFRQSTIAWLLLLASGAVLGAGLRALGGAAGVVGQAGVVLCIVIGLLYLMELIFLFPLIAKFENTTVHMFQNAILIPIARLPYAAAIMLLYGGCAALTLHDQSTILFGAVLWTVIGFALTGYLVAILLNRMFSPFVGEEDS